MAVLSANDAWAISRDGSVTEQWNGTQWTAVPPASALPADFRVSAGFIWSGGSLSGMTGGPLFAVGDTDNETTILQQPVRFCCLTSPGVPTSVVMGAIVTVAALAVAVNLLSSFTLKGDPA